jgi:hypothetical protein
MLLASFLSMSDLSAWCAGKNVKDDRLKCDGERHVGDRRFVYSIPGIRVAWLDWLTMGMILAKTRTIIRKTARYK